MRNYIVGHLLDILTGRSKGNVASFDPIIHKFGLQLLNMFFIDLSLTIYEFSL